MRNYQKFEIWQDVSPEKWHDWHWQLRNRITDTSTLKQVIPLSKKEEMEINRALE